MKKPPMIVKEKIDVTNGFGMIPSTALCAMNQKNMTDQARRLLLYYACQSDGFRPSAKTIYKTTRLSQSHVIEARKKLEDAGFIEYNRVTNQIHITWNGIPPPVDHSRIGMYNNT